MDNSKLLSQQPNDRACVASICPTTFLSFASFPTPPKCTVGQAELCLTAHCTVFACLSSKDKLTLQVGVSAQRATVYALELSLGVQTP